MAGLSFNLTNQLYKYTYYKYRSLSEFERFMDIIVNNRFYGATNKELNDPLEGKFNISGLKDHDFKTIYDNLRLTRIFSMMKKKDGQIFPDDFLMWSHYADEHKGCCIELEITKQHNHGWGLIAVKYQRTLPPIDKLSDVDRTRTILSTKTPDWQNEHEVRAIKTYDDKDKFRSQSPYYHVKVKAIYFGDRVKQDKCEFYKKIINKINPGIKLYKIREDKSQGPGFFPTLMHVPL